MKIASGLKVFSDSAPQKQEGSSEKCCFTINHPFLNLQRSQETLYAIVHSFYFDKWDRGRYN